MGFLIWLFVAFCLFFLTFKSNWSKLQEKMKQPIKHSTDNVYLQFKEGWLIFMLPLFWPIGLPGYLMWQLLELIYNKFNKNKQK